MWKKSGISYPNPEKLKPTFTLNRSVVFRFVIFGIALTATDLLNAQAIQTGKSYVNITKGTTGGTIEPGDILEIRSTIAVGNWSALTISNVRYTDTLPANVDYVAGSLRLLTNEGLIFKSYSDAAADDQAMYNAADKTLRINMGSSYNGGGAVNMGAVCSSTDPSIAGGGVIRQNGRPSFYGGVCIMSASYRIQIPASASFNSLVQLGAGAFRYRYDAGAVDIETPLLSYPIAITENLGLCNDAVGASAIIENNGTFGSGTTQNRSTSGIVPGYTFVNVAYNFPNDGTYAIINNLSANGSTNTNAPLPDVAATDPAIQRVHRLWDIIGDHTGAASTALGNAPVAPGNNGGYFMAINASYANTNAIQQTVSGLCPNTYYEFSAWFKNICKLCACDSTGDGSYSGGVPNVNFNGPDSSGVNPNLTFTIDGVDYYTTGSIPYTGQWEKRGFVYITGPTQTSFTVTIRNNAAGGGGNDWAIDDVTLATCTPDLNLVPSGSAQHCYNDPVDISCTVSSFSPNYTHWQFERSTDNGTTFTTTSTSGVGTPALNNGEYEYTAAFPTFLADSSQHNVIYRIRIGSSASSLSDQTCSFTGSTTIVVMVNNCQWILKGDEFSIFGSNVSNRGMIKFSTRGEQPNTIYEIERLDKQGHFQVLTSMKALGNAESNYQFHDPTELDGATYYRVRIRTGSIVKYSQQILISNRKIDTHLKSILNPFVDHLHFDFVSAKTQNLRIEIADVNGRTIKKQTVKINTGVNTIEVTDLPRFAAGSYVLRLQSDDYMISKKIIRRGNR
jgi:uncharacterized repeat protein (TIGR01451 family)